VRKLQAFPNFPAVMYIFKKENIKTL